MTSLRSSNIESYLTKVMSAESELITGELPQRQLLKCQDLANWIYTRVRPMVPLYFLSKLLGLKNSNRVALSCLDGLVRSPQSKQVDKETETSGRKNVLRKLLRILYRRLKAGFSVS